MEGTIEKGTRVRFTANRLGTMERENQHYFEEECVGRGDEGTVRGRPEAETMQDRWWLVDVEVAGRDLICPVHESQFEVVA